ncbi:Nramp family divalent metal transporter [Thalassoglobus sp.]|uniref:Nramp family divalent metal transporter n=1 Tax=Thalassoglobus sp. TaxID=2795869 RepID=UPI003AA91AEB
MNEIPAPRPWYTRIGPGLITACVVVGPGSIMTSSTVGANNAYSLLWIVVASVAFMMVYMTMGARLGVVAKESPGDLIRKRTGKWLAVLVGGCVFFISAAFQSGNNIGVAAAFEAFIDSKQIVTGLVIIFNVIAISFLFAFKDMYKMLERLMMTFVGLMLVSFAVNLVRLKPDLNAMMWGFVPNLDQIDTSKAENMLPLLGLMGTTFVISAAFYQAYLVHQKGWGLEQLKSGLVDARVGSVIMALITIMLMSTAAAGLYTGEVVRLNNPVDVAKSLEETFGASGKIVFCLGLFSAAYSSFIVNSMIGGFTLSDGLGLGSKPTDLWPRLMTTLALLTGMAVGVATLAFDFDRTPTIIAAQAVTVVGAPLVAGVLLWLTSRKDIMGEHVNSTFTNAFAGLGLVLLIAMAGKTAFYDLPAKYQKWQEDSKKTATVHVFDSDQLFSNHFENLLRDRSC